MRALYNSRRVRLAMAEAIKRARSFAHWSLANVPWGVRSLLGLLFLAGSAFSFLPVLGLWMAPVGVVLVSLDVPPWRSQVLRWMREKRREARRAGYSPSL
jgi:hypothetical protein